MHKTLFEIGWFSIRSYGVMLALAFWAAIELSLREAKRRGVDPSFIVDLGLIILVSAVVGARLLFVAGHIGDFSDDWVGVFRVWEGGLSFYGGFACGTLFGILFIRKRGHSVARITDIIAPQIALGIGIARIGCFLNGCCFGKECHLPWAVTFPAESQAGWVMDGKPIHPTQVYSAIANLLIFLFLRKLSHKRIQEGIIFSVFLITYGIWRFSVDFLRYYEPQMLLGFIGGITWTQIVSLAMIAIGVVGLMGRLRRRDSIE
ncbi:MAG: prolipoprotein diacylglyceryl transferase [bacterium]